jgi:hypothetical protein
MTHLRVGVATFAVLAAAACASAGQHTGDSSGGGDESVITATELRAAPVTNLFDYIRAHRPRWLQRNYSLSFHETQVQNVVVFLDDHEHGGPETLQTFSTTAAAEVRYYTPSEAEAHFGVGFGNGVIQVVSRTH